MRSYPIRACIALAAITLLASCHKKNEQGRLVPKNALFVLAANPKDLAAKLPLEDIYKDSSFENAMNESKVPASLKSICMHPDSSGVDMSSDLVFFVNKDSMGTYVAVEGNIKDANLFKTFNQQLISGGADTTNNDINYINHSSACVGWSKDKFVYVYDMSSHNSVSAYGDLPSPPRDVYATCQSLFALTDTSSLAGNEHFSKLVKDKGDLRMWVNNGSVYKATPPSGITSMLNLGDLYTDNTSALTVNFDDGKISMSAKSYVNDKLMAIYKKYLGDKVDENMIQHLPGKSACGVIALNFKPAGIQEVLKMINLDGLINMGLSRLNITLDDISKAFKGNMVFGATDIHEKLDTVTIEGTTDTYTKKDMAGNYVFAADIDDKASFKKINDALQALMKDGSLGDRINFSSNDNYFVGSNSKEATAQYLAGGDSHYDFVSDLSGEPIAGYVNLQTIFTIFESDANKDSLSKAISDLSLSTWKDLSFKGGSIHGDAIEGSMQVDLMDKSTNSLKQLHQYFSKFSVLEKKKEAEYNIETPAVTIDSTDDRMVDSTTVVAPH